MTQVHQFLETEIFLEILVLVEPIVSGWRAVIYLNKKPIKSSTIFYDRCHAAAYAEHWSLLIRSGKVIAAASEKLLDSSMNIR